MRSEYFLIRVVQIAIDSAASDTADWVELNCLDYIEAKKFRDPNNTQAKASDGRHADIVAGKNKISNGKSNAWLVWAGIDCCVPYFWIEN